MQTPDMRQEVTGLIVNKFVNVRRRLINQVRAMLHAWEKFGLKGAEDEYHKKYLSLPPEVKGPNFRNVVRGKIEFIRMVRSSNIKSKSQSKKPKQKEDRISLRLLEKYFDCLIREGDKPIIRTEGHTDWMHLNAAWETLRKNKKYIKLDLDFFKVKENKCFGNQVLMNFCKKAKKLKPFPKKIICVFDSDDKKINKEHNKHAFKYWGNNVYSFILPSPKGFAGEEISVEMFYNRKIIKTKDANGRRLFLSDEFNHDGTHKKLIDVTYGYNPINKKKIKGWNEHLEGDTKIIGYGVFKKSAKRMKSLALSKGAFARYILKKEKGFDIVNFDKFEIIFDRILEIIKD